MNADGKRQTAIGGGRHDLWAKAKLVEQSQKIQKSVGKCRIIGEEMAKDQ